MLGRKILTWLGGAVGLLALILWSGGFLAGGKIGPEDAVSAQAPNQEQDAATLEIVKLQPVTDYYEAVGTVRPRTETRVEAQVTAKVREVLVTAGDRVRKGDDLIILDSRELTSRRDQAAKALDSATAQQEQARRNIDAAKASFDKADSQYRRIKSLYNQKAVAQSELDQAEASYLQTEAALSQARQGLSAAEAAVGQAQKFLEQSQIGLDYAVIKALSDAEVAQRLVEPGDLAFPGKSLLLLQAGDSLRLEAFVPEGLISRVRPGGEMDVVIPALGARVAGVVEEVVPSADPRTRTFLVKVGLPAAPGMYPGMFGRLLAPMGERQVILVPQDAVRRVGQLETVWVNEEGALRSVYVKTGIERGDMVEILSGVKDGDEIAVSLPGAAPNKL